MSRAEPGRDRFELVLVLLLYVLPLGASVAFLALVGLTGLALALLSVEAGVSAAVVAAKQPGSRGGGPGRLVLALAAVSAAAGTAAFALLAPGLD